MNGLCIAVGSVIISFISMAVSNSVESDIVGTAMGISQGSSALQDTFRPLDLLRCLVGI